MLDLLPPEAQPDHRRATRQVALLPAVAAQVQTWGSLRYRRRAAHLAVTWALSPHSEIVRACRRRLCLAVSSFRCLQPWHRPRERAGTPGAATIFSTPSCAPSCPSASLDQLHLPPWLRQPRPPRPRGAPPCRGGLFLGARPRRLEHASSLPSDPAAPEAPWPRGAAPAPWFPPRPSDFSGRRRPPRRPWQQRPPGLPPSSVAAPGAAEGVRKSNLQRRWGLGPPFLQGRAQLGRAASSRGPPLPGLAAFARDCPGARPAQRAPSSCRCRLPWQRLQQEGLLPAPPQRRPQPHAGACACRRPGAPSAQAAARVAPHRAEAPSWRRQAWQLLAPHAAPAREPPGLAPPQAAAQSSWKPEWRQQPALRVLPQLVRPCQRHGLQVRGRSGRRNATKMTAHTTRNCILATEEHPMQKPLAPAAAARRVDRPSGGAAAEAAPSPAAACRGSLAAAPADLEAAPCASCAGRGGLEVAP